MSVTASSTLSPTHSTGTFGSHSTPTPLAQSDNTNVLSKLRAMPIHAPIPVSGTSVISTKTVPEVNVNGSPIAAGRQSSSSGMGMMNGLNEVVDPDDTAWGSNFWVTLVNPQTEASFYACPATGQVSWDPPVGNFVLPANPEGEWWEISDESRGGIPYYYQTKTQETVWERPEGFVIPLGILQNTALGRRLSQNTFSRYPTTQKQRDQDRPGYRRSRSYNPDITNTASATSSHPDPNAPTPHRSPGKYNTAPSPKKHSHPHQHPQPQQPRRSFSSDPYAHPYPNAPGPGRYGQTHLPPIPASPPGTAAGTASDLSLPPTPSVNGRKSMGGTPRPDRERESPSGSPNGKMNGNTNANGNGNTNGNGNADSISRARSKSGSYVPHRSPAPQSLAAAVEMLASTDQHKAASDNGHGPPPNNTARHLGDANGKANGNANDVLSTPSRGGGGKRERDIPPSPRRPPPAAPFWGGRSASSPTPPPPALSGREISGPILNHEATQNMSPVKNRQAGKPIPVDHRPKAPRTSTTTLSTGTYPILPHDLASDIQQFVESDYAKQYFSTHRTGFIFRRRVPVAQMMTWQKAPLNSPLLTLNRSLNKDAVKIFKVIQHIMGDRERDRSVGGARMHQEPYQSTVVPITNASTVSLTGSILGLLEEERWLLGEGLTHGELRDEIYCQLMKQLSGNPSPESVFKGWQLLCVLLITFPPSKNFETYLRSFMQQRTSQHEGRVDVMAKHCLRRLAFIAKKGPRGKPPALAEIETASDAAFNPSTFGESLDATIRLQERNYPHQKVPIILPFLADGILALGGTKSEGIFRVPGDGDSVSELKLRIDRGYYTLDNVDDPHVLASSLKLWLRELSDPLVPEEMYNECITSANEPEACVQIVERLPTINRRVVLFVISFLQLFLEEKIQSVTKMTPANLALVMAPNLLRCSSESMSVVFTNAQYEQIFVYNLLLHLRCSEVDSGYVPSHGLGGVSTAPPPRTSKSRTRRLNH